MKNNIKTIQGKDRQDAFDIAKQEYADAFSLISVREIKKGLIEMVILLDEAPAQNNAPQATAGNPKANNPYLQQAIQSNQQPTRPTQSQPTRQPPRRPDPADIDLPTMPTASSAPRNRPPASDLSDMQQETMDLSSEINKILQEEGMGEDFIADEKPTSLSPKLSNIDDFLATSAKEVAEEAAQTAQNMGSSAHNETQEKTLQEIEQIKGDISKLMGTLKGIQNIYLENEGFNQKDFVIPPEFSEVYHILKGSGILKRHLNEIFTNCIQSMPLKMKENPITVQRYFKTLLGNMILTRQESSSFVKRKIIMLVGPTGVGKTTTIAKIAARYSYGNQKNRQNTVGIITLDDYRLGALDQIMTYAKIMKLGIQAVVNPTEFVSAINSLSRCDYVLIDTAGSSPYNKAQISSIKRYLEEDDSLDINVSLVMQTNVTGDIMEDTFKNFSVLGIDSLILTKLDETRKFGTLFSFLFDHKKPISYFSVGQEVPDDIKEADKSYLIDRLFNY